jgi:hypothetical protein
MQLSKIKYQGLHNSQAGKLYDIPHFPALKGTFLRVDILRGLEAKTLAGIFLRKSNQYAGMCQDSEQRLFKREIIMPQSITNSSFQYKPGMANSWRRWDDWGDGTRPAQKYLQPIPIKSESRWRQLPAVAPRASTGPLLSANAVKFLLYRFLVNLGADSLKPRLEVARIVVAAEKIVYQEVAKSTSNHQKSEASSIINASISVLAESENGFVNNSNALAAQVQKLASTLHDQEKTFLEEIFRSRLDQNANEFLFIKPTLKLFRGSSA